MLEYTRFLKVYYLYIFKNIKKYYYLQVVVGMAVGTRDPSKKLTT